jgi:hypothetical protein
MGHYCNNDRCRASAGRRTTSERCCFCGFRNESRQRWTVTSTRTIQGRDRPMRPPVHRDEGNAAFSSRRGQFRVGRTIDDWRCAVGFRPRRWQRDGNVPSPIPNGPRAGGVAKNRINVKDRMILMVIVQSAEQGGQGSRSAMCEPKIAFGPAMPVRPKSGEFAVWPPYGDNQLFLQGRPAISSGRVNHLSRKP